MQTRESFLNRRFFDDKHYPYGFSRSGDFTLSEVQNLEQYGVLFRALSAGLVSDPVPEDQHFLKVIAGEQPAETVAEKAWLKYLQRCNRAPVWLTTRRIVEEGDSDYDDNSDLDVDYDEALEA